MIVLWDIQNKIETSLVFELAAFFYGHTFLAQHLSSCLRFVDLWRYLFLSVFLPDSRARRLIAGQEISFFKHLPVTGHGVGGFHLPKFD